MSTPGSPPYVSVPRGTVTRQVNTFDIFIGKECVLKIEYAPMHNILDLSKFQRYLAADSIKETTDLAYYCNNLHSALKTVVETKDLKLRLEAKMDENTILVIECKFKSKKRKRPDETTKS